MLQNVQIWVSIAKPSFHQACYFWKDDVAGLLNIEIPKAAFVVLGIGSATFALQKTLHEIKFVNVYTAGPYLGFFVCGGKLGFREISDQYSYKKQPSKIRHYVRKKTFSFPGGGNCPLRPPAMYGPVQWQGIYVVNRPIHVFFSTFDMDKLGKSVNIPENSTLQLVNCQVWTLS